MEPGVGNRESEIRKRKTENGLQKAKVEGEAENIFKQLARFTDRAFFMSMKARLCNEQN